MKSEFTNIDVKKLFKKSKKRYKCISLPKNQEHKQYLVKARPANVIRDIREKQVKREVEIKKYREKYIQKIKLDNGND